MYEELTMNCSFVKHEWMIHGQYLKVIACKSISFYLKFHECATDTTDVLHMEFFYKPKFKVCDNRIFYSQQIIVVYTVDKLKYFEEIKWLFFFWSPSDFDNESGKHQ